MCRSSARTSTPNHMLIAIALWTKNGNTRHNYSYKLCAVDSLMDFAHCHWIRKPGAEREREWMCRFFALRELFFIFCLHLFFIHSHALFLGFYTTIFTFIHNAISLFGMYNEMKFNTGGCLFIAIYTMHWIYTFGQQLTLFDLRLGQNTLR